MKTKIIRVDSVKLDKETYPRFNGSDWVTVSKYVNALKAGAEFPPITVAYLDKTYFLVDGYHRLEANKGVKNEHIQAEILNLKDKKEIYLEAVKRNTQHGKPFSTFDVVNITLKLQKMDMTKEEISQIIRIPADKIERFVAKRITRIVGGTEDIALKSPLKNLAGIEQLEGFESGQRDISVASQKSLLNSMITMLEKSWFNTEVTEIRDSLQKIYELSLAYTQAV